MTWQNFGTSGPENGQKKKALRPFPILLPQQLLPVRGRSRSWGKFYAAFWAGGTGDKQPSQVR